MEIFLTGASGFVGSHTAEQLIQKNHSLTIFSRRRNEYTDILEKKGAKLLLGNFDNPQIIEKGIKNAEAVIHIAGATRGFSEEDYMAVNRDYTKNLLEFVDKNQKFILMSSQAAAGPADFPLTEEAEPKPITWYGLSKLAAEKETREWEKRTGGKAVILRPSAVYGPREKDIFTYFKLISRGFVFLLGGGTKRFSIIYVMDLAESVVKSLDYNKIGTFFVTNDNAPSWAEMAESIKKGTGKETAIKLSVPEICAYPIGYISDFFSKITQKPALLNRQKLIEMKQSAWICSNEKIKKEMDWQPRFSLDEGIKETARWYQEQGWI